MEDLTYKLLAVVTIAAIVATLVVLLNLILSREVLTGLTTASVSAAVITTIGIAIGDLFRNQRL